MRAYLPAASLITLLSSCTTASPVHRMGFEELIPPASDSNYLLALELDSHGTPQHTPFTAIPTVRESLTDYEAAQRLGWSVSGDALFAPTLLRTSIRGSNDAYALLKGLQRISAEFVLNDISSLSLGNRQSSKRYKLVSESLVARGFEVYSATGTSAKLSVHIPTFTDSQGSLTYDQQELQGGTNLVIGTKSRTIQLVHIASGTHTLLMNRQPTPISVSQTHQSSRIGYGHSAECGYHVGFALGDKSRVWTTARHRFQTLSQQEQRGITISKDFTIIIDRTTHDPHYVDYFIFEKPTDSDIRVHVSVYQLISE